MGENIFIYNIHVYEHKMTGEVIRRGLYINAVFFRVISNDHR